MILDVFMLDFRQEYQPKVVLFSKCWDEIKMNDKNILNQFHIEGENIGAEF